MRCEECGSKFMHSGSVHLRGNSPNDETPVSCRHYWKNVRAMARRVCVLAGIRPLPEK